MKKHIARIPMAIVALAYVSGRLKSESVLGILILAAVVAILPALADLIQLRSRYSIMAAAKTIIAGVIFVLLSMAAPVLSVFPLFPQSQMSVQILSSSENWRIVAIEYDGPWLVSDPTIVLWREYVVCGHAIRLKKRIIDLVRSLDRIVMVESDVHVYDVVGNLYRVHHM